MAVLPRMLFGPGASPKQALVITIRGFGLVVSERDAEHVLAEIEGRGPRDVDPP